MHEHHFNVKTRDLIQWEGQVVMSRSEEPFLRAGLRSIASLRPRSVFEVGFGLGISARLIQRYLKPERHDIIEIDDQIFGDLRSFARQCPGVNAIRGDFWSFRPRRKYDFIFFDPFEYCHEDDYDEYESDEEHRTWAARIRTLLQPSGVVCVPSFGEDGGDKVHGFLRIIYKKFRVKPYLLEDGTRTTTGIIECWRPRKQRTKVGRTRRRSSPKPA